MSAECGRNHPGPCAWIGKGGPLDPICLQPERPEPPVTADHTPERLSAEEPMSPETRRRLIEAAGRPLKVRRAILLLAAHATGGHLKHPHGESCDACKEPWPCVTVRRAAGPALDACAECDPTEARILAARLADQAARLAAVEALADEWETQIRDVMCQGCGSPNGVPVQEFVDSLRAALHPDPTEPPA